MPDNPVRLCGTLRCEACANQILQTMIDRTECARALAKAIAYKICGKHAEANQWARKLVELLQCAEILKS